MDSSFLAKLKKIFAFLKKLLTKFLGTAGAADERYFRLLPLNVLFSNMPALPIAHFEELIGTLVKLAKRTLETKEAKDGLSNSYTVDGETATGYEFMFGKKPGFALEKSLDKLQGELHNDPKALLKMLGERLINKPDKEEKEEEEQLVKISLEKPEQYTMGWTNYHDIYKNSLPLAKEWEKSLTDADAASQQFWPTIANYGVAFNLLMLQKVDGNRVSTIKNKLGDAWSDDFQKLSDKGSLYAIDLSIFESVEAPKVEGFTRFTPSTITLLSQDSDSKLLTPVAVQVSKKGGSDKRLFVRGDKTITDSAWLYALLAAKTSVTVYGIWLGHVYHWHMVTASMQMTMYQNLSKEHAIYKLLAPESNYLVPFDDILLLLWDTVAPPTSVDDSKDFLELSNTFAEGREFFDDDPLVTLEQFGIKEADFTASEPWDLYPIVPQYLTIWNATKEYIKRIVDESYTSEEAVANDKELNKWINEAGSSLQGNIRGLPTMNSKGALKEMLTSLVYRTTMHGVARLNSSANPALTFMSNFPVCLQNDHIPSSTDTLTTKELLAYLPKTGTMGKMIIFLFTFAFSDPYESFIPKDGVESDLFFPGGPDAPRNQALIVYRKAVMQFIKGLEKAPEQVYQWPLNIET